MALDSVMVTMQLALMGYPEVPFKIRVDDRSGQLGYDPCDPERGYLSGAATWAARKWAGAGTHQIKFIYPCIQDYAQMYPLTEEPYKTIALRAQESLRLMQKAYTEGMSQGQAEANDEWQKLKSSVILIRDAVKGELEKEEVPNGEILKWDEPEHRIGAETLSFARHRIQSEKVNDYVYDAMAAMNNLLGRRPAVESAMAQLSLEPLQHPVRQVENLRPKGVEQQMSVEERPSQQALID